MCVLFAIGLLVWVGVRFWSNTSSVEQYTTGASTVQEMITPTKSKSTCRVFDYTAEGARDCKENTMDKSVDAIGGVYVRSGQDIVFGNGSSSSGSGTTFTDYLNLTKQNLADYIDEKTKASEGTLNTLKASAANVAGVADQLKRETTSSLASLSTMANTPV
jgi:hypothetical protein